MPSLKFALKGQEFKIHPILRASEVDMEKLSCI